MSWSLSYQSIRNPELADALLLAAGKALYLANSFESKCKDFLNMLNLVKSVESDPVLTLEQAIALMPEEKMLGGTLRDIERAKNDDGSPTVHLLNKAREARNFIAHEGAAVGAIWSMHPRGFINHASLLRSAVEDLVVGDNVVSGWLYEIEEKEPAPPHFKAAYPTMVDKWIFERIDSLADSVDLDEDHHLTLRQWRRSQGGE